MRRQKRTRRKRATAVEPMSFATFAAYSSNKPKSSTLYKSLALQPWFLPDEITSAIRSLIPIMHIKKMRFYFDDYGCLRCGKKKVQYGGNGFCDKCCRLVIYRTMRSLKRRLEEMRAGLTTGDIFVDGMTRAQRLIDTASDIIDVGDLESESVPDGTLTRLYDDYRQTMRPHKVGSQALGRLAVRAKPPS